MTKTNFIRNIIDEDLKSGKHTKIVTRFPPEPNGYLHVGHAKAICVSFGIALDYKGQCHLRFDDTNPINEEEMFARAIEEDVKWLGFNWGDHLYHSSDYFDKLYELAVKLIKDGKAFVCSLNAEKMREYRGTLKEPGKNSPDRDRSVEENLDLFERMRAGEFAEGAYTLRAKIDMAAGNINLRDPAIYRIRKVSHARTGDKWCIYPMYDFSHALSDAIEGITHSLCTLEFQDHRPLYDWFVDNCEMPHKPRQIEFSRLNLNYTITSKRKLKQLVEDNIVDGWDDPRMPTLHGMRRRGIPPEAIRIFCEKLGVSKQDSVIDINVLEQEVRDYLNQHAPRRNAILKPIKVVITNFAETPVALSVANHPQNESFGRREINFSNTIYIEADDFMMEPELKFHRLSPGKEVRLSNAYVIRCDEVIQNKYGEVTEIKATYDPDTLGGKKPKDGRKVKGIIHWVNAADAVDAEIRVYDRLFSVENPAASTDFMALINPLSKTIYQGKVEKSLQAASPERRFQFNRVGYFVADRFAYSNQSLVFNQIVSLRETWK